MKNINFGKYGRFAVPALALAAFSLGVLSNAQSAPSTAGIILVDRNAFFSESLAGQEIGKQVQTLRKSIGDELGKKDQQLRTEEEQLAGQQSLLTQEAFEAKARQAQEKRVALQREADDKTRQLQGGILTAQNKIWQAVAPILDDILKEKQAFLMIDRAAIVRGSADLDVTAAALERLNQKLPTVKVDLIAQAGGASGGAKPAQAQKAPGQ